MQQKISIETLYEPHAHDHVFLNRFIWGVPPEGRHASVRGQVRRCVESLRQTTRPIYLVAKVTEETIRDNVTHETVEKYTNSPDWRAPEGWSLSQVWCTGRADFVEVEDFWPAFTGHFEALTEYNFKHAQQDEAIRLNSRVLYIADRCRQLLSNIQQTQPAAVQLYEDFIEFRVTTTDEVGDELQLCITVTNQGDFVIILKN